jgi:hypothetical protein
VKSFAGDERNLCTLVGSRIQVRMQEKVKECVVICREYGIGGERNYVTGATYSSTMPHPSFTGAQELERIL